jgi:hypothetical protein
MSRTLNTYRSFWIKLPEQICKSTGISALNGTMCWTGASISPDGRYENNNFEMKFFIFFFFLIRSAVRPHYDKPLNLKLQRILKEMKQKSEIIGHIRRTTSGLLILKYIYIRLSFCFI